VRDKKMKNTLKILSNLIVLLLISTVVVEVGFAAPPPPPPPPPSLPKIYVEPAAIVDYHKDPGTTITVDVKVTEVFSVYGWGFYLYFKSNLLQVASVVKGDFFEIDTWGFSRRIYNSLGYVTAAAYFDPEIPIGIDGSGTLATVTFNVVGVGITLLDLTNTKINTLIEGVSVPIEHTAEDGLFDNRLENTPPSASFMVTPPIGAESDVITFDASASSDDGWIVDYLWDFGDRTTGFGKTAQHTYTGVGVYPVTLTVTDNEGATDSAQYTLEILSWSEGGHFPDLMGEMAWPEASVNPNEDKSFNEKQLGEALTMWAKVGNPTDQTFEVRVDFKIYSDEGRFLGTVSSDVVTINVHETLNVPALFHLDDSRWRNYPYWRQKFYATAYCFHSTSGSPMESGRFPGELWFRINAEDHDRAIIGMTATSPVVSGEVATITVTVENQGWASETATVFLTADGVPIGSQQVTIGVHEQATLTFYWDTTGYKPDSYYIEAKMAPHPFERDTFDNVAHLSLTITG